MESVSGWTSGFRPLGPDAIHVWQCPLDASPTSFGDLLSHDEIERRDRFRLPHLRARFATARGALRFLLGQYLGVDPRTLKFLVTEHGKPYLENDPLHFNISHSGDLMVAAFTPAGAVGVDVEKVCSRLHARDIAKRYFQPAEQAELDPEDDVRFLRDFYRLWTAKEALMKVTSLGFALELSKIHVGLDPLRVVKLDWGGRQDWVLTGLVPQEGFRATVAAPPELRLETFTLNGTERRDDR